ncbi:MAG TPA: class I SAM-dependent methyltransferase [Pyrinomonadaceae bacterium]|nr:class I SAM-dependent methyltransferase [Pyrinomonadaceae bacterium]
MDSYQPETYGESVADVYDDWYADYDEHIIPLLVELAAGRRALELGIGTGRIALPLAQAGVEVHGIDASPAMVERLRAKPGGANIPVSFGDFAEVNVAGEFGLVYVVFNTFFALLSQEAQVRCFQQVAAHLAPGGCFLIEAFVPDVTRFAGGQIVNALKVTTERVELEASRHDAVAQRTTSQRVVLTDGGLKLYPVQVRYAWPAELDLMARLAGLGLRARWAGWQREPFTAQSGRHVSVYERAV